MAVGSSNGFDLIILGGGTGGYSPPSAPASWGSRSLSSTRTRSAGLACIAAASRPRPCSSRPRCTERVHHLKDFGLDLPEGASASFNYGRWRPGGTRSSTACGRACRASSRRTRSTRSRAARVSTAALGSASSQAGEDGSPGIGGERILNATDVILATGSRVKSLPGLVPDGVHIVTCDDVLRATICRRT